MSDEVLKIRQRIRELRELHFTGFVDDAQYAEAKGLLQRKLADAVKRKEEAAIEAQFAPTMMLDPASLPSAAMSLAPAGDSRRWVPWVAAAALAWLGLGLYAFWRIF
jgi:hypothetical protein